MDKLGREEMTAVQLSARTGLLKLRRRQDRMLLSGQAVTTLRGVLAR